MDTAHNSLPHPNNEPGKKRLFIVMLNPVDLLTLSGVVIACCAIALMLEKRFMLSLSLLYLAVICDAFDGILARKLKLERDFGRYLDSFVDVLDYLIAPALFLYLLGFDQWHQGLVLIVFIMCGIIRLSVFNEVGNISNDKNDLCYLGAPVFWSTLLLGPIYIAHHFLFEDILFFALLFAVPAYSFAMIHNSQYFKFKNPVLMLVSLSVISIGFAIYSIESLKYHLLTAFLSILPIAFAGVLHMIIVKKNIFSVLARPIHLKLFGASKTWRGLILMPIITIVGFYILFFTSSATYHLASYNIDEFQPWLMGLFLGFAYILAELPNSYMKRRLGIPAGTLPKENKALFILIDQLDSIIGCGLVYMLVFKMPVITFIVMVFLAVVIALAIKRTLYRFGYKYSKT